MKKPIHLYIFLGLSTIASLSRIWTAFISKFNEAQYAELPSMPGMEEVIAFDKAAAILRTGLASKIAAVLMLAVLIVTLVLLIKKRNEQASYSYIGYLFMTLLFSTYQFVSSKGLTQIYSNAEMRQVTEITLLTTYGFSVVLFLVYLGLTLFFLFRKPKEKPSMAQTSTDI